MGYFVNKTKEEKLNSKEVAAPAVKNLLNRQFVCQSSSINLRNEHPQAKQLPCPTY